MRQVGRQGEHNSSARRATVTGSRQGHAWKGCIPVLGPYLLRLGVYEVDPVLKRERRMGTYPRLGIEWLSCPLPLFPHTAWGEGRLGQ